MNKKIAALTILCFTLLTSGFAKPRKPKDLRPKITILDYLGKDEGKEIPSWVEGVLEGEPKSVIMELGLNSSDKVFVSTYQSKNFEDLLLKGRVEIYANFVRSCSRYVDITQHENSTQIKGLGSLFTEVPAESTEDFYSRSFYSSIASPYGIFIEQTSDTSYAEEFIKFAVTPYGDITGPEGEKLSDPYQSLFKWFRNSDNVRFDEFWIKFNREKDGIYYTCYTVMSMSEENYAMITKWINEEAEKELAEDKKQTEQLKELLQQKLIDTLNK